MYAMSNMAIQINDNPTPKYNDYINNEYELTRSAKQIAKALLMRAATQYAMGLGTSQLDEFVDRISFRIEKQSEPSWNDKATEDAKDFIKEYLMDEIVERLIDLNEVSTDLYNDYANADSNFHDTITDKWYGDQEALELIHDLYQFEEEDNGLWEGVTDINNLLSIKAAFTYGNAVYAKIESILSDLNDEFGDEDDMDNLKAEIAAQFLPDNSEFEEPPDTHDYLDEIENFDEDTLEKYETALKEELKKQILEEIR